MWSDEVVSASSTVVRETVSPAGFHVLLDELIAPDSGCVPLLPDTWYEFGMIDSP